MMTPQPAESRLPGNDRSGCDGPQELRLTLAVEASLEGFWEWCPAENAAWYSPRWQQICGFDAQEHIAGGDHWLERVHLEDKPMVVADLRALQTGRAQRLKREHRVRHQDGSYRWVLARGVAERNAEGRVSRIAGSLTDTTERRMADPLTGLPNRLFFSTGLNAAWSWADRRATGILLWSRSLSTALPWSMRILVTRAAMRC